MRRSREVIAARRYCTGATGTPGGGGEHRDIWTELIPSGAPMVFGAAVIATHPAQEDKQHHALLRGTLTLSGMSAVASGEPLQGNEMQFPSSVNEVVMRRLGRVR